MHLGFTVWLTGKPGAGKTTVSGFVAERLRTFGASVELLDGDAIRTSLSKGFGFSKEVGMKIFVASAWPRSY